MASRVVCFVVVAAFSALPAQAGAKVFLVPPAGADAVDVETGMRQGLGTVTEAAVADAQEVKTLVDGAKSTGLDCAAEDGACWLRIAVLGGHDHVVFASSSSSSVTHLSATTSVTSPVLGSGPAAWAKAVRRTFGLESALRLAATPASAVLTIDGKPAKGVVEGLAPGSHKIDASAPGFVPSSTTVNAPPGAIVDVNLSLTADVPAGPSPLQTGLLYGGGGAAALGIVGGTAAIIIGQAACEGPNKVCGALPNGETTPEDTFADTLTVTGIVMIGALGVGGIGAVAGSFFVD